MNGIYRRLLGYLKPYRMLMVGMGLATLGFAIFDAFSLVVLIPFLKALFGDAPMDVGGTDDNLIEPLLEQTLGRVVNSGASEQELLVGVILFILGVFFLKNVFDFLRQFLIVRLEQGVTFDARNEVYEHLLKLDLRFFGKTRAGQIISRLTGDVDRIRLLMTQNMAKCVTSVFQILVTLVALLAISWELTVVSLIVLPGMFGIWGRLLKRLKRGDRRLLDMVGDVASHLQETVSGMRLVKAAAAERFERERFRRLTDEYRSKYIRNEGLRVLTGPLTEMMGAVGTVLLLWYGSHMVLVEQSLDGATFIAFLGLSMKLYSPVKWLSKFPAIVQPGVAAAERVFEFLDAPVEIHDQPGAQTFRGVEESIRFEELCFAYEPGEPVLRHISFDVPAGTAVALVGPSGAGKTTLIDLLARFYEPTSGRITIDGVDLRELTVQSLRSRLGVVTQETVLFHDTVRSNIAYGLDDDDVSQEAVERAAWAANAHEFVTRLPDGYDTVLGERGTRLSGGQRQRIAIARAILRDPPILIFDEATSSLDSESEQLVQRAIERLLAGRTVFMIAHRLSTIRHASQILVMDEGRIVERGTHTELLARDGLYRRLYRMQFAVEDERAARSRASIGSA